MQNIPSLTNYNYTNLTELNTVETNLILPDYIIKFEDESSALQLTKTQAIDQLEEGLDDRDGEVQRALTNTVEKYNSLNYEDKLQMTQNGFNELDSLSQEVLTDDNNSDRAILHVKNLISNLNDVKEILPKALQVNTLTSNVSTPAEQAQAGQFSTNKVAQFFTDFDWAFLSTCDVPTRLAYAMLFLAKCPITESLKELSGEYVQQGIYAQMLFETKSQLDPIPTYFANNPTANINVFESFNYWVYVNHPGSYSASEEPDISAEQQNFANTSGNSFFEGMYNSLTQYNQDNPNNIITAPMLALGDTERYNQGSTSNFPISSISQQVLMSYFVFTPNSIAGSITNSDTQEVFNSNWTQISEMENAPAQQLYQPNTINGVTTYSLSFTASSVQSSINSASGVLQKCQDYSDIALRTQNDISTTETYYGTLFNNMMSSGVSAVQSLKLSWLG